MTLDKTRPCRSCLASIMHWLEYGEQLAIFLTCAAIIAFVLRGRVRVIRREVQAASPSEEKIRQKFIDKLRRQYLAGRSEGSRQVGLATHSSLGNLLFCCLRALSIFQGFRNARVPLLFGANLTRVRPVQYGPELPVIILNCRSLWQVSLRRNQNLI